MTPVLSMLSLMTMGPNPELNRPVTWLHSARHGGQHPYREMLRGLAHRGLTRRVWYEAQ